MAVRPRRRYFRFAKMKSTCVGMSSTLRIRSMLPRRVKAEAKYIEEKENRENISSRLELLKQKKELRDLGVSEA